VRDGSSKTRRRILFLLCCSLFLVAGPCQALTLNPQALEAALWKQNTAAKLCTLESTFRLLITAAVSREDSIKDLNTAGISSERDRKAFAETAKKIFAFDESILNDVKEILWVVPTTAGLTFYTPEEMRSNNTVSTAAIVKVKLSGYRDNKFFGLALSGLKQSRIITMEDGPVAWLMPDISQTQVLIEQTAKMIREMKGQKQ